MLLASLAVVVVVTAVVTTLFATITTATAALGRPTSGAAAGGRGVRDGIVLQVAAGKRVDA